MKKKSSTRPKMETPELEDWDLSQDFGILPKDIALTQNIGCVSDRSKSKPSEPSKNK
jgi:hypothetical protein